MNYLPQESCLTRTGVPTAFFLHPTNCSQTPKPQNGRRATFLRSLIRTGVPSVSSTHPTPPTGLWLHNLKMADVLPSRAPLHGQGAPSFSSPHSTPPPALKLRTIKMANVPSTSRKLPTRPGGTLRLPSLPYLTTRSLTTRVEHKA